MGYINITAADRKIIDEAVAMVRARFLGLDSEIENLKKEVSELRLELYKKLAEYNKPIPSICPSHPGYPMPLSPGITPSYPYNPTTPYPYPWSPIVTCGDQTTPAGFSYDATIPKA